MMEVLLIVAGILTTFFVVVLVHESGHYFAGRLVGVRPEIFALGFGPKLLAKKTPFGGEFQLRILPLGGYVRFVGDQNAASLVTDDVGPVLPGSLRSVSLPKRAFVALAGPAMNFALAVVLFALVALQDGPVKLPWQVGDVSPVFAEFGLRAADVIEEVGGIAVASLDPAEAPSGLAVRSGDVVYAIRRDGASVTLSAPLWSAPMIGVVASASPAEAAGLQVGDILLALDETPLRGWAQLVDVVGTREAALKLSLLRDGEELAIELPGPDARGETKIGIGSAPLFELETAWVSPGQAALTGVSRTWGFSTTAVSGIAATFLGAGDMCKLHGPVRIAQLAGRTVSLGWPVFLQFLAVISASLGLMNLLPFPILDGGHVLAYAIQGVTGRPPGKRVSAALFILGLTGVLFLMLSAILADILC